MQTAIRAATNAVTTLTACAAVAACAPLSEGGTAGSDGEPAAGAEPAAIMRSAQHVLRSEHAGHDFLIQIAEPLLPPSAPAAAAKLPVVYVTDGANTFGPISSSARTLPLEGLAQFAYVVAIGYPTEDFLEIGRLRARDLVHAGAGGDAFEAFVRDELRPFVEARYPVDPDRSVLVGHSLGGLFAANVLSRDPRAFHAYVIGSPWLELDPSLPRRLGEAARQGGGTRVFVGVGALEGQGVAWVDAVAAALGGPGSRFSVRRETFDGETHVSSVGLLLSRGLRHVLPAQ